MSLLDKKYILTINLDNSTITYPSNMFFFNTDKNIANIYVKVQYRDDVIKYISKTDAVNYNIKLTVIKPKSNNLKEVQGVITNDFDEDYAIYKFELPSEFTDQVGLVVCEFLITNGDEILTTSSFSYEIKASKVTGLNAEITPNPDLPVLKQLIEDVKSAQQWVSNIDDTNISEVKTYSSKKINQQFINIERNIDVDGIKVHFPSRGGDKADCAIIETKESVTIIDVGWEKDASNLINYLISKKLTKIDNLIISHYHDDHVGGNTGEGLKALINSDIDFNECICYLPHKDIDYSRFIDNVANGSTDRVRTANESVVTFLIQKGITMKYPTENEILKLGGNASLKFFNTSPTYFNEYYGVISNNSTTGYTRYNNFSLVCELTHINKKFLFTGDIEEKAQELLLYSVSPNIDVYKVEHHGTNNTTFKDFIYKVSPKIAVLQNRSKLGIKGKMTTTYLFNKGCKVYDNTDCGDIIIKSNGIKCFVESEGESKIDIGFDYCAQPFDLKRGLAIKQGDDLDNYMNTGVFYSETTDITNSLSNKPVNCSAGFRLVVQSRQTDTSPIQTIIDSNASTFIRLYKTNSWTEWKELQVKSNSLINARISNNYTTTTTEVEKLNLDTISSQYGNGLTLKNSSIYIGAGITKIRISGQIGWASSSDITKVLEGYIYINSTPITRNAMIAINTYFGVPLTSKIIDVKEGDTISLYARSRTESGLTVASSLESTWLCVETI